MTLILACILIKWAGLTWGWYLLAGLVWVLHVAFYCWLNWPND